MIEVKPDRKCLRDEKPTHAIYLLGLELERRKCDWYWVNKEGKQIDLDKMSNEYILRVIDLLKKFEKAELIAWQKKRMKEVRFSGNRNPIWVDENDPYGGYDQSMFY